MPSPKEPSPICGVMRAPFAGRPPPFADSTLGACRSTCVPSPATTPRTCCAPATHAVRSTSPRRSSTRGSASSTRSAGCSGSPARSRALRSACSRPAWGARRRGSCSRSRSARRDPVGARRHVRCAPATTWRMADTVIAHQRHRPTTPRRCGTPTWRGFAATATFTLAETAAPLESRARCDGARRADRHGGDLLRPRHDNVAALEAVSATSASRWRRRCSTPSPRCTASRRWR